MRNSIAVFGLLVSLVPAIALAQVPPPAPAAEPAPPPTMAPGTVPPPATTMEPAPGTQPPMYAAPAPMASPMISAAPKPQPSLKGVSIWGIWGWGGLGVGARFMIPLSVKPLLQASGLRDHFALELGADFTRWSYNFGVAGDYSYSQIVPVAGVMWMIWLNEQFALYPKIEAGVAIGWVTGYNSALGPQASHGWLFVDGTGGLLYKLNNGLTLRAEGGYAGLKVGIGWLF